MKRIFMLSFALSSLLVLASCNDEKTPIVEDVKAEAIKFKTNVSGLKVGDTLKLEYEITPTNATNKEVIFTSSNEEVLKVDNEGNVTTFKEGESTIKVSLKDTTLEDSLTIKVVALNSDYLEQANSLLDESLLKEKSSSNGGNFNDISFKVYEDSLQINYSENNIIKYYLEGKTLKELLLNNDKITDSSIGTIDAELTSDDVSNYLNLFQYNLENKAIFGISNIVKELLNSKYFYSYQLALDNLKVNYVDKDSLSTYTFNTKYIDESISYNKKYYENNLTFSFNKDNQLVKGSYDILSYNINDYDEVNKVLVNNAKPIKSITSIFNLSYLTRVKEDKSSLNKSDYLIKSFEIDTTHFRNKGEGEALLYVGDELPIEVKNVVPKVYLEDTFTVSNISDESVITTTKNGKVTYLKALKKGEAIVTIETSLLKTSSIKIKVSDIPINKIEIGEGALTNIDVGQSAIYKVNVSPFNAIDKSWSIKFESEEMSKLANLTVDTNNSTFTLKGLSGGKVKVIVTSNANKNISTSIEVTINALIVSQLDTIKNIMIGSTYKAYPGTITFIDGSNGKADFSKSSTPNDKCTFTYSISEENNNYVLTISNLVKDPSYSSNGYYISEGSGKRLEPNTISKDGLVLSITGAKYTYKFNKQ